MTFRSEQQRLGSRIADAESSVRLARTELARITRRIEWLEAVEPQSVPVKTAKAETGLADVPNVRLLETRKQQGRDVWTAVDIGTAYLTDRKLVFSGSKDVQFRYDKITSVHRIDHGLHVAVSTRKRSHVLAGPVDHLEAVLAAARSYEPGVDPAAALQEERGAQEAAVLAGEAEVADLRASLAALERPPRPVSPAWAPAGALLALGIAGSLVGDDPAAPEPIRAVATSAVPVTATTAPPPPTVPSAAPATTVTTSAPVTTEGTPGSELATVTSVTDGDTIRVRLPDGAEEPLRLIGIDAPEGGSCLATEAADFLEARLAGGDVELARDVSDRDRFDRLLRYVYVDGALVNEEIVRAGLAMARRFEPDTSQAVSLEAAQAAAQAAGAGMWNPRACGSPGDASLVIEALAYDDTADASGEWLVIANAGPDTVDLTGWWVADEEANGYTFPAGFTLAAGGSVVLHTGCGDDTASELFWCGSDSAIWDDDRDTVFVRDPADNVAAFLSYDERTPSAPPTTEATTSTVTTTTITTTTITTTTTTLAPTTTRGDCHPSYPDVCIPPPPPDLDCGEISFRRFTVIGSDPHRFDGDNDGVGCES